MYRSLLLLSFVAALVLVSTDRAEAQHGVPDGASMAQAANEFIATLNDEQRERTVFAFEDEERFNFHYTPVPRLGLPLKEMRMEQLRAAHALLRTALSSRGYLKATSVMELEAVLRAIEAPQWNRDRALYYVSIFGTPEEGEAWGWRFEGHHLSLNYTSVTNELTTTTPAFFGANPAEVRTGPTTGLRVLGAEEDLGRRLVLMLDAAQREQAIITEEAPREIITRNNREAALDTFEGLSAGEMNPAQRDVLWAIVEEFIQNHRPDLARKQLDKIDQAGFENVHFAWAGGVEPGKQHYYRVHGPTVLIEFDNTQGDGNHIHSVLRDLTDDFGEDLLRKHYDEHPHD